MIFRHWFSGRVLIVSLAAFGLLAVGTAQADIFNLIAEINEAQANSGNGTGSAATGSAEVTYNDATGDLGWNISWTPLEGNITVAHFHGPAAPGTNAGVQVDFGAISGLTSPSIGNTTINATQGQDLLDGLWYINIHTDRDSITQGGEIRGQVLLIPEPATLAAISLGTIALVGCCRRRRRDRP